NALTNWCKPAIAGLSRDKDARQRAVLALPEFALLARAHPDAGWLELLLSVLDAEPFLVLHPATRNGYEVRVSGVADNFQLHILLADALIGAAVPRRFPWLRSPRAGLSGRRP